MLGSDHLETVTWRQYPLHARAVLRHATWARDLACAGDLDEALGELADIAAMAGELRDSVRQER